MIINRSFLFLLINTLILLLSLSTFGQSRLRVDFNQDWKFFLGDLPGAKSPGFKDQHWQQLSLPHDWSIAGKFDEKNPAKPEGGGLPTGIGWYRKTFTVAPNFQDRLITVEFDGVYKNAEVWINGHYLGKRPYGYSSFSYEISAFLQIGRNTMAVKVDNSAQPDSRWYSGSGIYRNVWLTSTSKLAVAHWGTYVNASVVNTGKTGSEVDYAWVHVKTDLENKSLKPKLVTVQYAIYDTAGTLLEKTDRLNVRVDTAGLTLEDSIRLSKPRLWSVDDPYQYKVVTRIFQQHKENHSNKANHSNRVIQPNQMVHSNKLMQPNQTIQSNKVIQRNLAIQPNTLIDQTETLFGVRYFKFDAQTGFYLNGVSTKILGVCLHHDLGALGAAVNTRAIERQLEILKAMGCNAIRTAHNPPSPEFLNLCDKMGFLVMDEAFDMWKKKKNTKDYHLDFAVWHQRDLEDMLKRDRNHPSIILWSIGNEIREQFDSTGVAISQELAGIVKNMDKTRPVISALTETDARKNFIYQANALDIYGLNYNHKHYKDFPLNYPGVKFLATETTSALATRGFYDTADTIRRWPKDGKTKFTGGNKEWSASSYDNVSAYWGSTHEETWKEAKKYAHVSGLFVWTGFDYLGEPLPYPWPARSSYFGIVDLAGFPKDAYYMYQSEWTKQPVLHLLPHWNWEKGKSVEVWAYYNQADEVELYLNGRSLGKRVKQGEDLHVQWTLNFEPGTLRAVSRKEGKEILVKTVTTAGPAAKIELLADRKQLKANGKDLSFVTVRILDEAGNLVPDADQLVQFGLSGAGTIAGVDNGFQASLEPFKAKYRKAFHGLCLAIIQAKDHGGAIKLTATAAGLKAATITIHTVK